MGGMLNGTYWIPERLASCWSTIPIRLGYVADPAPVDLVRAYWEARITEESRHVKSGRKKDSRINASSIEKIIAHDHSVSVVTGGTVVDVIICQDLLHIYDSTCSWWADMWVCGSEGRRQRGYESYVEYRPFHSNLVMSTLYFALVISGAEFASPKPFEQGLEWERGRYSGSSFLMRCSPELAISWPSKLLDNFSSWRLTPLCPAPHPGEERYLSGSLGNAIGGVKIYSGPALDLTKEESTAFLAIEPYGYFPRARLAKELTSKAIECGARLAYKPKTS